MHRSLVTLLLSLLVLVPALAQEKAPSKPSKLSSAEKKQAKDLIKQYFKCKTTAEKSGISQQLQAIDHPSRSDISSLYKLCFKYAMAGPRISGKGNTQTCTHPDYPGTYILTGAGRSSSKKGIFISLHGGGQGVGDGRQIQRVFGQPGGGGMIHVYPTVIKKVTTAWNKEREEQFVLAIIEELKRSFRIDTNRIYLAGHSMGGYGTWSIGPRHADLFAAISPQAGGLFVMRGGGGGGVSVAPGTVFNLKNLPIWFYNSTDDKQVSPTSSIAAAKILAQYKETYGKFDYVWKKYTDIGHGFPKDGLSPIWKWMLSKKRNPYPKRVLWEPSRTYKNHMYWLRRSGSGKPKYDVQRNRNTFTVTGTTSGLSIMVNKKMISRSKEVVVKNEKGEEIWKGKVGYSLVAMVESIEAKRDLELWFDGMIKLP